MNASKSIIVVILTIFVFGLFTSTCRLMADDETTTLYPQTVSNYNSRLRDNSYLAATSDGYMRIYYDGEKIGIENYDGDLNITSVKTLEMELSIWGGFYRGNDAYYLVEGENNTAEDDDAEVIRVIKYDFDWNRQGAAKITGNTMLFGGEVRYPFDYGCVKMAEYDGTLYIVTGHQGYVDSYVGQGHQGFLMIEVDESTMNGSVVDSDLWHSLAQYIRAEGSDLYVLEQSEGSRCTQLSLYNADNKKWDASFSVLDYGGQRTSAWAVACYATVDGLELSSNNVLGIGTSIDQSLYDTVTNDTSHNIYLTVTPKSDMSKDTTTVKWLTDYKDDGKTFTNVKLTKINDNRFLVTWGEWEGGEIPDATDTNDLLSGYTMHYVFIDENGNKLTREYTASGLISDCQPIVKGSDVVFFTSNSGTLNFYTIDANNGKFAKKIYRTIGENVTWGMDDDGVLTISGRGVIEQGEDEYGISPMSTTSGWFSYSTGSVWTPIKSSITAIKINDGITEIGEKAFYRFTHDQKNVDIYIPDSVTSIGTDALWSGWYWGDYHYTYMTIYCNAGSYAHQYAKENGIKYVLLDLGDVNGDGKITTVDAKWVLQAVSGSRTLTSKQEAVADVNGDGKITTVDAKWILQAVSGSRVLG